MSKTASSNPAIPGQPLTYTVTVLNLGPDPAAAVTLGDPLPAGTTLRLLLGRSGNLLGTGGREPTGR